MISETTIQLMDLTFRLSRRCYVMPFSFDKKTCRVSEVRNDGPFSITIWRPLFWSLIVFGTVVIVSSVFLLVTDPIPPMHEIVVTTCFGIILCMSMVVLYTILTRVHDVELMLNRFFIFDETFRERFGVERVQCDGTEWVMKILLGLIIVEPCFEFPAFLLTTLQKWKLMTFFLSLIGLTNTFFAYPFSVFLTIIATTNALILFAFAFTAILTQNTAIKWLKERNSKVFNEPNISCLRDSEVFYRSLQLLHGEITSLGELAAPAAQLLTITILVVIPFSVIKFWRSVDRYTMGLLIIVGTAALLLFSLITTSFSHISECSWKFRLSHQRILNPSFIRSCQPLRWKMGTSYYITRSSLLTLLRNFVIKAIIRLILAF